MANFRFIATFVPQKWQGDTAIEPEGFERVVFDVTQTVLALEAETPGAIADIDEGGNDASDGIRHSWQAPRWVREWDGPFEVYIDEIDADETHRNSSAVDKLAAAKETTKINGPCLTDELRRKLLDAAVRARAAEICDEVRNGETDMELILRDGYPAMKDRSNSDLLEEYKLSHDACFLESEGLEANEFGDVLPIAV